MGKIIGADFGTNKLDSEQIRCLNSLLRAATEGVDVFVENKEISEIMIRIHTEIEEIFIVYGVITE